jgi:hypothetical protein
VDPAVLLKLVGQGGRSVARGGFQYWLSPTTDRPDSAVCLMRFFGGFFALGFVVDPEGHEQMLAMSEAKTD